MYQILLYCLLVGGVIFVITFGKLTLGKMLKKDANAPEMYILLPVNNEMHSVEMHLRSLISRVRWGSCKCSGIIIVDMEMGHENSEICRTFSESSPIVRIVGNCAEVRDLITPQEENNAE